MPWGSGLLLFAGVRLGRFRRCGIRRGPAFCAVQEFFRFQAEPLNDGVNAWPLFAEKLLPLALQQQLACAGVDEHAEASSVLDKPLVHQLLIALQDRERVDPVFSSDIAHRGQRIAFLENTVEYHRDHPVAKLAVDWLSVIPFTVHQVLQIALPDLTRDTAHLSSSGAGRSARALACPQASCKS